MSYLCLISKKFSLALIMIDNHSRACYHKLMKIQHLYQEKNLEFFTVKEFAKIFKVHPNTVYRAIDCGRIQAFRVGQGKKASFRIFKTEIERMAAFDANEMIENIIKKRQNEHKLLEDEQWN